jgi:hypothetical protein
MPIHENAVDRSKQDAALAVFGGHLKRMGVSVLRFEPSKDIHPPYDSWMWVNGLCTGVVEVKNIKYTSESVEGWGQLMLKHDQLLDQARLFYRNGNWTHNVTTLVRTSDNVCYVTDNRVIQRVWKDSEIVPPGVAKNNHGTESSDKEHRFITLNHWSKIT